MKIVSPFFFIIILHYFFSNLLIAQEYPLQNKFKQLDQEFSSPNTYRTASGSPGHEYWQQKADYDIDIILDDHSQKIYGTETITYYNNSPHKLNYIWIQLDQNVRKRQSLSDLTSTSNFSQNMRLKNLKSLHNDFDGGFKLNHVKDNEGNDLKFIVNHTMMRIDLAKQLLPGENFTFNIKWWYNINETTKIGGRSGMEYFKEDDNYLYSIAQFYPRLAVYSDAQGWQNQQFLGDAEFALTFGDFNVNITVPADHIVAATGELQNSDEVLSTSQKKRLDKAKTSNAPLIIVSEGEAKAAEKKKVKNTKTWQFSAKNVRDFAFASSRKFIWDAMGVHIGGKKIMAMSYYPKEANPLWGKFSTQVVAHTLKVYSKHIFDYPYPVAISIEARNGGMEYPMISFNGIRPEPDGTYSERTKWGMIGTIIHEVGHNYFPMIVNSDERKWAWMDEGLNTFVMGIAERQWDYNNTTWMGKPTSILDYMKRNKTNIRPIMTNTQSIFQIGNNAYLKTASALTILRETIMGRELFDFAFKQYAQKWKFKHPTPEDFFRTMEDASAVDLDWFWRGWFYTTDRVDISLDHVSLFRTNTHNPDIENPIKKTEVAKTPEHIALTRDKETVKSTVQENPSLRDFYYSYDPHKISKKDKAEYEAFLSSLSKEEKTLLSNNYNYYELQFSNIGGLVMPLIIEFEFEDGEKIIARIPAEIWRKNNYTVKKIFPFKKLVKHIVIDPFKETADVDTSNNYWPKKLPVTRFNTNKHIPSTKNNPMQTHKNKH
ncbi:M1 family metallopeptidase [Flavivirga spongiicola]|uniref:M1 family metallopeptidase n=1 Tax=Flavivirga spongiicola TaxID=421621 RepID=A0ABU7XX61_9FLAO|nr:M1 family metallopeptidase [Flavivirga sp. MEBiC05379]MDO5980347.1 M1 family metallopeptidase [Flavivirga sp. MEBiC05379]